MTEEEIDKLFVAWDQSVKPLGYAKFEDAIALSVDRATLMAEDMKRMLDRTDTRKWLRETFPDPDPADIKFLLQLLPNLYLIRRFAPQMAKTLPHPPGGRPKALSQDERERICKESQTGISRDRG